MQARTLRLSNVKPEPSVIDELGGSLRLQSMWLGATQNHHLNKPLHLYP